MKELGKLVNKTDRARDDIKSTMDSMLHQQLIEGIKHDNFDETLQIMTGIATSPQHDLKRAYMYKFQEAVDCIEQANEVCEDYHLGKFDVLSRAK